MPSHQQNYETWNHAYDWSRYGGDEWSAKWGGPDMQWYWCIYPRIQSHLPTNAILDIGPGYGRWTPYLLQNCRKMALVDISERCIHACKKRFKDEPLTYHVGPGDSLGFLPDRAFDFAFSWETLVYCEDEAVSGYLRDLSDKLTDTGTAFLHHSNIGCYERYFSFTMRLPKRWRDGLKKRKLLDYDQWRARSVTADSFAQRATEAGLHVWSQEQIPWGGRRLIDCFTVLGKQKPTEFVKKVCTPDFHSGAYDIQRLSWMYGEGVPW